MLDHSAAPSKATDQSKEAARRFLSGTGDIHRYVLGRNQHALRCAERISIDGIVDDFCPENTRWNGYPVFRAELLDRPAIVINCSMSIRPLSAHARLSAISGIEVLSYAALNRADPGFPLPDFVASFRSDVAENEDKWRWIESILADEESKATLRSLMLYRMTGDYAHMSRFAVRFSEQYFDPAIAMTESEVFVDCGGFDGDTVLEFCRRVPKFKHIYSFEPSPINLERAAARLVGLENVSLVPLGVSDSKGTLSFDASAGSASAVNSDGATVVDVVTIDGYISQPVTYIKMDLEGWELRALMGAARHIRNNHPKLAISVYHHCSDFWRIPEYVLGIREDYDVHLRHYSEGWSESVMYFIPRARV